MSEQLRPAPGLLPRKVEEHPHPLSPLVRTWTLVLLALLFATQPVLENLGNGELRLQDLLNPSTYVDNKMIPVVFFGLLIIFAGFSFVKWRFTWFVIDDDELRIEFRFIAHSSTRIAFSKIQSVDITQPLTARVFGLAALKIDVGAGESKSIEFLKREEAYKFRDYLMKRASRQDATVHVPNPKGGVFEDLSQSDEVIVAVPVTRILGATLLSTVSLFFAIWVLAWVLVAIFIKDATWYFALIPAGLFVPAWVGSLIKDVTKGYNFKLSRNSNGLKAAFGLTELTSKAVPVHRIQGVLIAQPLLWRLFGWYRVVIDILGATNSSDGAQGEMVLLPVGTRAEVQGVLQATIPFLDLSALTYQRAPKKARLVHPITASTLMWGCNDDVIVQKGGVFVNRTDIILHSRVQEVVAYQGIWLRLLGLARVSAENTPGPVRVHCGPMPPEAARQLAMAEPQRMRQARVRLLADSDPKSTCEQVG